MNDIMSFGAHRLWKKELINFMNIQTTDKIIDVGSGTGDLIKLILKKKIVNDVYSVDLNNEMLKYGKMRFIQARDTYLQKGGTLLEFHEKLFLQGQVPTHFLTK